MSQSDISPQAGEPGFLGSHPRLRSALLYSSVTATVLTCILTALPFGITAVAESWLHDHGAPAASIEDIDFNPFTGKLQVSNLQAGGSDDERLHIGSAALDIRWWPLASKRVHVKAIRLDDVQMDIIVRADAPLQIGMVKLPPATEAVAESEPAAEASLWGIGSDLVSLTNITVAYRDSILDSEVLIKEIMLGSNANWNSEAETPLIVDLEVDGVPLILSSDVAPWASQRHLAGSLKLDRLQLSNYQQLLQQFAPLDNLSAAVSLDLMLSASINPQGKLELQISGPVDLTDISIELPPLVLSNTSLQWNARTNIQFPASAGEPMLSIEGTLQLTDTQASLPDAGQTVALSGLDWSGLVTLTPQSNDHNDLRVNGNLTLSNVQAELEAMELEISLAALHWSGTLNTDASELTVQGSLASEQLSLNHKQVPFELVTANALNLDNLLLEPGGEISLPQASMQGLRLLGTVGGGTLSNPDLLTLEGLQITGLALDASRNIRADSVTLQNPVANLVRNADGGFNRIDQLLEAFSPAEPELVAATSGTYETQLNEPPTTMSFAIGELKISAEKLLAFSDRSVKPAASFRLNAFELDLKDLASGSDQPASLVLNTSNDSMTLTTQGTVNLLSDSPTADLSIALAALDLPPLSSYLPGFNIERGRFSTTSTVKINGEELKVDNAVLVERLQLSGKETSGDSAISQGMGMPLDAALALLRDSDDRISLNLPVTGSLSDPQFDFSAVLRRATQNALQSAALSYVKNALQPLGALLMIGNLAAEAARPRFEPVAMEAGRSRISPTGQEYLLKIGKLLTERPALQLSICSVASIEDRVALTSLAQAAQETAALEAADTTDSAAPVTSPDSASTDLLVSPPVQISDEAMLQLAGSRTAEVISFLINETGVARSRLFTCRETLEARGGDGPRTEITL